MNIIEYEEAMEAIEAAGINVKEYNNYIIQQTISNVSSKMLERAADVISLVSLSLELKHEVYTKLSKMNCNANEFDALSDSSISLLIYALGFKLEEICDVFHASPLVVSTRVSRFSPEVYCTDVSEGAFERLYNQILEYREKTA